MDSDDTDDSDEAQSGDEAEGSQRRSEKKVKTKLEWSTKARPDIMKRSNKNAQVILSHV
jgi:hypothetical protein